MRYHLNEETFSESMIFESSSVSSSYQISGTTKVYMGGDHTYSPCLCYLQYLRIYLDYVADSKDNRINLAMMDANCK